MYVVVELIFITISLLLYVVVRSIVDRRRVRSLDDSTNKVVVVV